MIPGDAGNHLYILSYIDETGSICTAILKEAISNSYVFILSHELDEQRGRKRREGGLDLVA